MPTPDNPFSKRPHFLEQVSTRFRQRTCSWFEQRIVGRGLLVERWVLQAEILAEETAAAFLMQCERNLVLKALCNGVLMVGWSMVAELSICPTRCCSREARSGGCLEVERGRSGEELREQIEMMTRETKRGREMRRRAREAREMEMIQGALLSNIQTNDKPVILMIQSALL